MIATALVIIVTLPVTLPVIALQERWRERRLLRLVSAFVCVKCSALLGAESLRLGDERWQQIASDMYGGDRTLRYRRRVVRSVDAVVRRAAANIGTSKNARRSWHAIRDD